MNIKGAIFDMDGTLVDSLMFWDVLWRTLGEKYCNNSAFRPNAETEKAVRTLSLQEGMHLLHRTCAMGESGDALFQTATDLCAYFYAKIVHLKPGVETFLKHCKKRGIRMCVASASERAMLNIVIKRFGLDAYFSRIFSCGDIGKGKEFPDVFEQAHVYLGTPKDSTWVFEDSVTALQTAVKAGFQTVGIYDAYAFDEQRVKELSTVYIARDESLERLIPDI